MHSPQVGGSSARVWLGMSLVLLVLLGVWANRERTLANTDMAKLRQAHEESLSALAQTQEQLRLARARIENLASTLAEQHNMISEAQTLTQTVQSQSLADQATQDELARQIRRLQQENGRLKQDLAFFQSTIPKEGLKGTVMLRRFEAQRIAPTQVRWQALVVQPVKNAAAWEGSLNLVLSGELDGKPWSQVPAAGPTAVNLVQFVRLEGVMTIPADAKLLSITAKLLKGKRVAAVQTYQF